MKTFETEKNNIPEGATHYHDESIDYHLCWFKLVNFEWFVCCPEEVGQGWVKCDFEHKRFGIKRIPTETTEEKEALDAIERVEWDGEGLPPVGVECEFKYKHSSQAHWNLCKVFAYSDEMGMVAAIWHWVDDKWKHATIDVSGYEFRAIETPEQRKEREELEAAYDLYYYAKKESVYSCVIVGFKEFVGDFPANEREEYLSIVRKTGYRKGE